MTQVLVTTTQAIIEVVENNTSTTVVTPPAAVQLTVSTSGPAGPPGATGPVGATGPGVPENGATNSLLVKSSDADFDTEWTSIPTVDALRFDTTEEIACQPAQLSWNIDEGTLNLCNTENVTTQIGQETLVLVRNNTASQIDNGRAVMFTGSLGNSGRITVAPMISTGAYPGYVFLGIATDDIPAGADGYVTTFGKVRSVDTRPWPDGTVLWCDPLVPGGLTSVEPHAPALKLPVAAVINSARNGILMVRSDTGRRLQDLHDVEANGDKDNGDVLTWNQAASRWEASPLPAPEQQALAGLSDVDVSEKEDQSILYYDQTSSKWVGDNVNVLLSLTDGGNF